MTAAVPPGPSVPPEAIAAGRPAAMRFIMLVVLIDMLGVGLIVPVLPALVGRFTAGPADQTYWVTFSFALASFISAPLLGALSDRLGRRPILLLGFMGVAVNFFMGVAVNFFATALATSVWMLIASRLVGGAMQANAAVANAYVADITPPEQRARRFGLLGAMFGIGFILGPVLGGLLGGVDLQLPFFVAGGLALLNLAYGYFVLPESLPAGHRRPVDWSRANPLSSLQQLARLKGVGLLPEGRWPAGRCGGLCQPGAVHAVHDLGALRPPSSSAGGRLRTVGPCSWWASCRPWCRVCCWAAC